MYKQIIFVAILALAVAQKSTPSQLRSGRPSFSSPRPTGAPQQGGRTGTPQQGGRTGTPPGYRTGTPPSHTPPPPPRHAEEDPMADPGNHHFMAFVGEVFGEECFYFCAEAGTMEESQQR